MKVVDRTTAAFFVLSILVFAVSGSVGVLLTLEAPADSFAGQSDRDALDSIQSTPALSTLLVNNLAVIGLLAVFPFCLVVLMLNGFNIGNIVGAGVRGENLDVALALVAPHGVFEFTAMFLAGAVGLRLPYEFVQYLRGRKEHILRTDDLVRLGQLMGLAILLIVVAAVIEAYLTLEIAERAIR